MQKNVGAALAAEFTGTALVLFSLVALDGEWSPHDRVPLTVLFILAQGGGAIVGAALANSRPTAGSPM